MDTIAFSFPRIRLLVSFGILLLPLPAQADDWPQWRGPTRDGVWHERGILEKFPANGLQVRWRVPVGMGYSSPVIAQGRVFVTDCDLGPAEKRNSQERVHCFDEASGELLWTHSYDADYPDFAWPPANDYGGPVASPVVRDGRVYLAGAVGDLLSLDARTGAVLWKKNLAKTYAIGGDFCRTGSPLIEEDLLIVQTACNKPLAGIIAFHKDTGQEVWSALDGHGYYSSPIVVTAGGKRQLIAWAGLWVTSLDPATGETYWRDKFSSGRSIPTPVFSQNRLLVNGLMFALGTDKPTATVLWPERKPDAHLSDTTTAVLAGELVLSHKRPDRLVCLEAGTGKLLWETDQIKSSMHTLTLCGDAFFVFTDQGELIRALVSDRGYEEVDRTSLISPTTSDAPNHKVVYAAPAFANGHVFARNDKELICASLFAER